MKIIFVGNTDFCIYNYRFELVERLLSAGNEVIIASPRGEYIKEITDAGCRFIEINVDSHGTNPIKDLKLKKELKRIFAAEKPDYVLGYTIKPNIYGAWACRKLKIPFIANITGLGSAVENGGLTKLIAIILYKFSFTKIRKVFCQNEENMEFFKRYGIAKNKLALIPGSGVNLEKFTLNDYPDNEKTKFCFVSRIRKDKGIDQYIDAARYIKARHPDTEFHVFGKCEEGYDDLAEEGSVIYHGMVKNIQDYLREMNCLVLPTYYPEGLSNVLLEACATGLPIITTARAGCREVVDDGVNGYIVKSKSTDDLIDKLERFLSLSYEERKNMGLAGRRKTEQNFDRNIIVKKYMEVIGE